MRGKANSAALALLLAATLALAGCGQKGPLTLPDRQSPSSVTPPTATPATPVTPAPPATGPSDATTATPQGESPTPADDREQAKR